MSDISSLSKSLAGQRGGIFYYKAKRSIGDEENSLSNVIIGVFSQDSCTV
jgi:hypothetical protein